MWYKEDSSLLQITYIASYLAAHVFVVTVLIRYHGVMTQ